MRRPFVLETAKGTVIALITLAVAVVGTFVLRRRVLALLLRIPQPNNRRRRQWVLVPTPDGHQLATQILTPTSAGPHPTLLMRTPYGQGWRGGPPGIVNQLFAELLVERGFNVVQQDVRGRFNSTGEFAAFQYEREDGLATLDWLEGQPWFDGRLGLFGQSYGGFVQWAIADDERVRCMVPIQTSARLGSVMHDEGTIAIETALRFLCMMAIFGAEGAPNVLKASWMMLKQTAVVRPPAMSLPLLHTDEAMLGRAEGAYREALMATGVEHPYWAGVDHTVTRDRSKAPALFITGWLDPFLRETLADFTAVQREREAWLTCGVWPRGAISGAWLSEVFTFLDHHLKGGPPPEAATGALRQHDDGALDAGGDLAAGAREGGDAVRPRRWTVGARATGRRHRAHRVRLRSQRPDAASRWTAPRPRGSGPARQRRARVPRRRGDVHLGPTRQAFGARRRAYCPPGRGQLRADDRLLPPAEPCARRRHKHQRRRSLRAQA